MQFECFQILWAYRVFDFRFHLRLAAIQNSSMRPAEWDTCAVKGRVRLCATIDTETEEKYRALRQRTQERNGAKRHPSQHDSA